MVLLRKLVTLLLVFGLLFVEACNRKKPVLPPPAHAPTIAVELPDAIPENPDEVAPTPVAKEEPAEAPPVKTKPKKTTRTAAKKTPPPATAPAATQQPTTTNSNQTVASLRPPAAPDTAIAAAMPSEAINRQKEETAQIVDTTENNLKNLSRSLNDDEKAMKTQIQSYLQQSRKATTDGDFERAFNLAKKAQLLADALIKK
jgi:hypothetical protein